MVARLVNARPQELRALAPLLVYFFCLLCGYYVLRPLREEMDIAGGVETPHWTFIATFFATLCVVPPFGRMTARFHA